MLEMGDMDRLVDDQVKTFPSNRVVVCNHTADGTKHLGAQFGVKTLNLDGALEILND